MKIKDMIASKGSRVFFTCPKVTLRGALCAMVENKIGALPVINGSGALMGIISERDIMREVFNGSRLDEKQVGDVMTREVTTGSPDDDIDYVMNKMTEGRFRHMPIIEGDQLTGIVSIGDVVKTQLDQTKTQFVNLVDYVTGSVDK
ncbi:MAG: CBS domain-containing protein [bacterium]|nr:CBS domain-containing protein [bacterium]